MPFKVNFFSAALWAILLLAFLVRVINLNYNSPFLDEAIYVVLGKKILSGNFAEVASSITWVGGFPFFYPTISAIFFSIGGILATRFFNVILGTIVVFLTYQLAKQLFPSKEDWTRTTVGLIAAALMATSAIPISSSRLANYDMLAVTIFLVGLIFLVKAIFEGEKNWYLISVLVLFVSFLAKYVVAIFFPFFLILTIWLAAKTKNQEMTTGILKYFWLPLIFLTLIYGGLNFSSLKGYFVNQAFQESSSAWGILQIFWRYTFIYYILSSGAFILLFLKKQVFILAQTLLLLAISLVPLVAHLLKGNILSAHQHTIFSQIFILPLAGVFFLLIIKKNRKIGILLATTLVIFNLFLSIPKVKALESFWPNTNQAVEIIKNNVSANDKILAEADGVVTIALYDKLPTENITGPFYFSYQNQTGLPAYLQAVGNGYFNLFQLDGTIFRQNEIAEIESLANQKYSLIYLEDKIKIYKLQT